jgi:hypothetical protein
MLRKWLAVVLLLPALAACDQVDSLFKKVSFEEETTFAKQFVELLQARDFDGAEAKLDPAVRDPSARQKLTELAGALPVGAPNKVSLINWRYTSNTTQGTRYELNLRYEFPDAALTGHFVLTKNGNQYAVRSVSFDRQLPSL